MVGVHNLKPLPYTLTSRDRVLLGLLSYYPANYFQKPDLVGGAGLPKTNREIFRRAIPRLVNKGWVERKVFNPRKTGYKITPEGMRACKENRVKPFRGFDRNIWNLQMSVPK